MKIRYLLQIVLIMFSAFTAFAQDKKPTVWEVESKPNMTATVSGSLKDDGVKLSDLSWAWNSSVACFPATQKNKFTGHHVLFVTKLLPRSILTVTAVPKKSGVNLSVYGYQIAADKTILPEDLVSAVTCEADYKWDYPKRGRTQGDERTMTFNATTNSYNVVIGVAGADGLTEGDFSLAITLKQ